MRATVTEVMSLAAMMAASLSVGPSSSWGSDDGDVAAHEALVEAGAGKRGAVGGDKQPAALVGPAYEFDLARPLSQAVPGRRRHGGSASVAVAARRCEQRYRAAGAGSVRDGCGNRGIRPGGATAAGRRR